jgi:hypothetical protein
MPPLAEGDGDSECPAWAAEPFLHYVHRLAQQKGMIPPGPNPHAEELKRETSTRDPGEDG